MRSGYQTWIYVSSEREIVEPDDRDIVTYKRVFL